LTSLSPDQRERYARQIVMPDFGEAGQERLGEASVLVVGAGGLGSPCAYYLAAAGVGRLGIVDADDVELSNLQRQILHATPDLGRPKVESAAERLRALNPDVQLQPLQSRVSRDNVAALIEPYDLIVDASDNFATKYLLNDACVLAGKTLVHAGISAMSGECMVIVPGAGPCLRCAFPEPPPAGTLPTPREAGVLGSVAGMIGALQATETLKALLGLGRALTGRMLAYDGLTADWRTITIERDPTCALCGDTPTITALLDYDALYGR